MHGNLVNRLQDREQRKLLLTNSTHCLESNLVSHKNIQSSTFYLLLHDQHSIISYGVLLWCPTMVSFYGVLQHRVSTYDTCKTTCFGPTT
jgi:hypothetical protein